MAKEWRYVLYHLKDYIIGDLEQGMKTRPSINFF